jgi:DnaJ family protein C protein 11
MGMSSEVQLPVSKKNTVVVGGNLVVNGTDGTGAASAVLRHQLSSVASVEFMATAGLRSLISVQTFRQISPHSTATSGLALSLRDGSINLSNAWTRQLSDNIVGNIQLALGTDSSISVGWQKKDEKNSAAGDVKVILKQLCYQLRVDISVWNLKYLPFYALATSTLPGWIHF